MTDAERQSLEGNIWRYQAFMAVFFTPFFVPVVVLFWQENGLDLFDVYLLQGLFAVSVVLLEVPTGMVADRLGKRTSIVWGTVIILAGVLIYALSTSFTAFFIGEVVLALAISLISGADSALLYDSLKALGREDEYKSIEGRARGLQLITVAASSLGGGFIGAYSTRATWFFTLIGPAIALLLVLGMREVRSVPRVTSVSEAVASYRSLIAESVRFVGRHQLVRWQIAFMAVLTGSAGWLLWVYQPYMELGGLPIWMFGVAFALFNLFAAWCARGAHGFDERLGRTGTFAALAVLQVLPPLLMALHVAPWTWIFILGHQAVRGLARPILSERILRYTFADKRSTVLSIASLAGRLFFAATAAGVGWVTAGHGIVPSLFVQAVILASVMLVLLLVYRRIPAKYMRVKDEVVDKQ